MSTQLSLFDTSPPAPSLADALAAGAVAADACAANAEARGWDRERAAACVLAWLRANGPTAGEVLVDEASRENPPHDGRAFGAVFKALKKAGLIEVCGFVPRTRGHGAPGLRWSLTEKGKAA